MDKFIRLLVLLLPISVFAAEPEKAEQLKCGKFAIEGKIKVMDKFIKGGDVTLDEYRKEAIQEGGCNLVAFNEYIKRNNLDEASTLTN